MSQKQIIKSTDELVAIFHKCHNILRNNEGIVGLKALTEFSDLLFLKLLEPMIDNEEIKLPKYCKFSEFSKMPEEEMYEHVKNKVWQQLWKLVPDVYHGNYLEIKYPHTLKEIIKVLDSVDFDSTATDIKGSAYEHFISRELVGKTLGQFFTPRQVVNEMIEYVKPKIHKDGTSETIYDPACGTGGFLVQAFNYLKVQKGVDLKWIQKNAVHGSEINSDTVRICKLNMLCAGDGKSNIVKRDSLRYCPEETYDIVLANPPFGIKGIKFDMLGVKYPIESNTAEFLFLENIVKVLKKGGRAAVVLPEGVLFKTGVGTKLREWLLKEVNLERVVSLSQGTFEYAGVKTAILYFTKPSIKKGDFATKEVIFSNFGEKEEIKLKIDKLKSNNYSLMTKQYDNKAIKEKKESNEFWSLDEIVDIEYGSRIVKKNATPGPYDVYGGGGKTFTSNEYNRDFGTLVISRFGMSISCVRWIEGRFYLNDNGLSLKSKNENLLLTKYLFYFLEKKQKEIYAMGRGAAMLALDMSLFKQISIPQIELSEQIEVVKKMDFIHEQLNKSKVVVVENIQKEINLIMADVRGSMVKVGDYFDCKMGKPIKKEERKGTKYPYYGANGPSGQFMDEFIFDGDYLVTAQDGSIGATHWVSGKFYPSNHTHVVKSKDEKNVLTKFLYYWLKKYDFMPLITGAVIPKLTQENLKNIEFPLISLDEQKRIVDLLDKKSLIIELIKKDLMSNDN